MTQANKTYFNWSSGKDAAMALYQLQKDDRYSVDSLLTSVNGFHDRVSMHGLRKELLLSQVNSIGVPLKIMELPEQPGMEEYEQIMNRSVLELRNTGYTHAAFGDIYLQDLREYREEQLKRLGVACVFPIWKKDTRELIQKFISEGFKAIIICCNANLLDKSFAGRQIDSDFLNDLPENVDPCGENGEFHTFCYDGPIFQEPVKFEVGELTYRSYPAPNEKSDEVGFWFRDLVSIQ